jgi:hypothetical protein
LAQQAERDAEQQALLQKVRDDAAKQAAVKAQERADAERTKSERRQAQAAANFDAEHKPGLLAAWQTTGGSAEDFEKAWPALRSQLQMDVTRRVQEQARASMATLYREF